MPLYEYDCPKCGRFEVLQKMSEPALDLHDCGSKVQKLMSASAFSFKGSGFYITDYKKAGAPASSPVTAPEKPKADDKAKAPEKSSACDSCPSNKAAA
jgi:putative FmdB family regulatory protein